MDLYDAMRTNNTCRYFKPDPVSDGLLVRVLDAARWAPSGGNRQPLSIVVVREPEKKRRLRDLYLPFWDAYLNAAQQGRVRVGGRTKIVEDADNFARRLAEVPVMLVVCARLGDIHATDADLGRLSIVGGASIYPAVQNVLLAARAEGLGTALTTLLCGAEPEVKALLGIPAEVSTAAMVAVGWPARPFPNKLNRRPLREIVFGDRYGDVLSGGEAGDL